jgi:hypothetical protein
MLDKFIKPTGEQQVQQGNHQGNQDKAAYYYDQVLDLGVQVCQGQVVHSGAYKQMSKYTRLYLWPCGSQFLLTVERDEEQADQEQYHEQDEHDEDEGMLGMLKIQPRELKGTCISGCCISGCCVKKTFIKYVYKNKDIIDKKVIDQITSSIYDISLSLIQQAHHIKLLDQQIICPKIIDALERKIDCMKDNILELEKQCGYIDSEIRTHGSKIDNLHCNTRTSHSHSHNYNPTKLVEAIEDLSKIVKKTSRIKLFNFYINPLYDFYKLHNYQLLYPKPIEQLHSTK